MGSVKTEKREFFDIVKRAENFNLHIRVIVIFPSVAKKKQMIKKSRKRIPSKQEKPNTKKANRYKCWNNLHLSVAKMRNVSSKIWCFWNQFCTIQNLKCNKARFLSLRNHKMVFQQSMCRCLLIIHAFHSLHGKLPEIWCSKYCFLRESTWLV